MQLIFKIARTELRNLFYSPVAWFLTLIFLIMCAYFYTHPMVLFANMQDSLLRTTPRFTGFNSSLTRQLFLNMNEGTFMGNLFGNLYLFIPLLTMGLINRDFNSGAVKLLYSSPVKINQIVWGKYLAIMAYNMILIAIILVFVLIGSMSIVNFEYWHLLAGMVTIYLVVCAYTAIGMFMSSITSYQIVSAIATFTLLFILGNIGSLWQEYDFIRDVMYFLSINGRADRMVNGLITTRDVMYYALITYMFVTFSYLSLRHGREIVSKSKKAIRYLTVFISVLIIGYLTSRPGYVGYWDATRTKSNTIKQQTQDIIKNMQGDEPLEVTLYTNLLSKDFSSVRPSMRNHYIWGFWDQYIRFKPNIKLNYVLYYDQLDEDSTLYRQMPGMSLDSIAREYAKMTNTNFNWYLKPAEIRKQIDLSPEGMKGVMLLKYKNKNIFLRILGGGSGFTPEHIVAAALKRLSTDTVPKVYATTGYLERNLFKRGEREYSKFSLDRNDPHSLINNGFEFDTLNLDRQDIPSDARVILLADPKVMLSDTVNNRLARYINNGGNMLIVGEPGKQHVLNPLLQPLGVTLMPGALVQPTQHETPDKIYPYFSNGFATLTKLDDSHTVGNDYFHVGVAGVSYSNSSFKPANIMVTHKDLAWAKTRNFVTDSVAPVLDIAQGDYKLDSFNVAIALRRDLQKKQQKLVIAGDADFASNLRSHSQGFAANYLSWLTDEAYPIRLTEVLPIDNLLTISLQVAKTQKLILLWIVPGVVLLIGILLLLRRNRQ